MLHMRGARRSGTIAALAATFALLPPPAAGAAQSDHTLEMSAHIAPRFRITTDRQVVILRPGERAIVFVTLQFRVAVGEALPIILEADPVPGLTFEFAGRRGSVLGASAEIGTLSGHGMVTMPLVLTLAPGATDAGHAPVRITVHVGALAL
jgi:hypothetical protein